MDTALGLVARAPSSDIADAAMLTRVLVDFVLLKGVALCAVGTDFILVVVVVAVDTALLLGPHADGFGG